MRHICIILCFLFSTIGVFGAVQSAIESADFLASQGIIVNHSDDPSAYETEKQIQRQAVMKIVMKLSGEYVPDTCRGDFRDVAVNDWPCKYIETALDLGFIAANNDFRPYDNLTKTEAMKLVLRSKSIGKTQETSAWQEDYMETAYHYGIIEEKYSDYNAYATRGWIFQIAAAAIEKEDDIKKAGGIVEYEGPEGDFELEDDMTDEELDDFFEELLN